MIQQRIDELQELRDQKQRFGDLAARVSSRCNARIVDILAECDHKNPDGSDNVIVGSCCGICSKSDLGAI